ncbi:AraC family transcriptional regulator [Gaetbulibacter sp. M235]|uniref:helix-turn-helix domain-containing protein n=1 Tax=Gaetbulibacter sp. M235 TaxID=3126510 RepID=UPI00374FB85D
MITKREMYELFGKLALEKVTIKTPFKIPNPTIDEACFLYVIEGEINYQLEKEQLSVHSKDALLLKCGNYFSQMKNFKTSKIQEIIFIHFHPDILKKIYEKELPKIFNVPENRQENTYICKINNDFLIKKYIEGLLFYFDNPSLINEEIVALKLKEIILLLCQTKNAPIIQQILSQLFSPIDYTFKQLMDDHIFSNLSIKELAELSNLSLSSFKREFKKVYHDSPANYIKSKKLEMAAELLFISDERVTNIAFDCGFNDLAHFSKSFQDKFKCSPSNYRLNQKKRLLN